MQIYKKLNQYMCLIRLNKPIGIFLLLWPTLWALWLAGKGHPAGANLLIFIAGVVLMRSAGCIVNDIADRHVDGHVERTRLRPIVSGQVSVFEASVLAGLLGLAALILVLFCNRLTIQLAFVGAALAVIYPLMKRFTHLPQFGLGVAFSWGIPMAFAAEAGSLSMAAWFLFLTSMLWPVIYDTMYAMVDKEDDQKIGVKSTAILFGSRDRVLIGVLQFVFVVMLAVVGLWFDLPIIYDVSLVVVGCLFAYQQWLIKDGEPKACFSAFLNNNWVGMIIFLGIVASYSK